MDVKHKSFLEVDQDNVRYYRMCKNLLDTGECFIKDASDPEWKKTLQNFGISAKPLIEKKYLEPIWRTSNRNHRESRLIRVKKNTVVKETKGNKISFFEFFKK